MSKSLIATALWILRKACNNVEFHGINPKASTLLYKVLAQFSVVDQLSLSEGPVNDPTPTLVRWERPNQNWVKINCDESLHHHLDGGDGFVAGTDDACCLFIGYRYFECQDALYAEAVATMQEGLQLTHIETDSMLMVDNKQCNPPWKILNLICNILYFLENFSSIESPMYPDKEIWMLIGFPFIPQLTDCLALACGERLAYLCKFFGSLKCERRCNFSF